MVYYWDKRNGCHLKYVCCGADKHVDPTNYFWVKRVSNWQPKEQWRKQSRDKSITNDNLFVVGYRIGKVQLVCVEVVGEVSSMIDVGSSW